MTRSTVRKSVKTFTLLFLCVCLAIVLCLGCAPTPDGDSGSGDATGTPEKTSYYVACLGDSITQGIGVKDMNNHYTKVLEKQGYISKMQNVGFAGATVADTPDTPMSKYAFVNRCNQINKAASVIFVFGGTNDYNESIPLGSENDESKTTFFGALNYITSALQTAYPDAKLLYGTPLRRDDAKIGTPATSPYNANGDTLENYRDAIVKHCTANSIEYIDFYDLDGMRTGDAAFNGHYDDGLHPNDAGSKVLAAALDKKLRSMLSIKSDGNELYYYPGEDYSFATNSAAYGDENYAEGKTFEHDGYTSTVHWIKNRGNNIYTMLSLPDGYDADKKYPALVCCHGLNATRTEYDRYLPYFTAAGFAVITFDFRGGSLDKGLSDGELKNMTIDTEISDVKAVTAFAASLEIVDENNLVLVGHSQGGLVAALAAATDELKDVYNGLLMLAPGLEMVQSNAEKYKSGDVAIPKTLFVIGSQLSGDYIRSLLAHYDVYDEIAAFRNPVKIMLGTTDGLFTESAMQKAVDKYGDNAAYVMVENGSHDFSPAMLETLAPAEIIPFLTALVTNE